MIYSMTGFGKAVVETPKRKITVEVKSLNSKQLDLSTRIPSIYRAYDMAIRTELTQRLERGKVEFLLYTESVSGDTQSLLNVPLMKQYYDQMLQAAQELQIPLPSDWFVHLLRMPDVMKAEVQEAEADDLDVVMAVVNQAIDELEAFRLQEGARLVTLFTEKIGNIASLLEEIIPYEEERVERIRIRITDALTKIEGLDYDKNRLEQEMIFYIEKLDVNEEKHRLKNHLNYFIETMGNGKGQGKKLGFIAQEIGREINTLGSKSNHAEMQQIVVRMKDELEQIKEQILNVM